MSGTPVGISMFPEPAGGAAGHSVASDPPIGDSTDLSTEPVGEVAVPFVAGGT